MRRKLINSQLNNLNTYNMHLRQCTTLAENVFKFKNLPTYINKAYLNKILLRNGSIAFFVDEILGLLALPYNIVDNNRDVYDRPTRIEVRSNNGYHKVLDSGNFVIMYDNNGLYSLLQDIFQYAERLALCDRTCDINIDQQKTPRFWKTKSENEKSVKDLVNNVDGMSNTVITYNNIDLDDTTLVLQPAPFVADKVKEQKEKIWNEFLRLIGVANTNFQKKERNIKDEVTLSQGGTIASRFSRFEPRKDAIDEINEKFANYLKEKIEVEYFDGLPTTLVEEDEIFEGDEEDEYVQ